ncbi:ankyrin repeat protein, putative [Trichomonas vaginalis G3]|uniref:Ankyrin repeat protein, putative n=1 Tax=Trichomonas vaginalis (strain ATCC PRA-98 / G3) TaxID=412133 RepID=A2DAE6_TRIV3|nr:ankyrin repeat protein family [Trichomonas vaginalis G3]EAY22794.1 ankyrin repeat protein, putative [Trichomonas vaginalis G3]KAI5525607.1 ankyrin repeat protein family [Trichomonas vaginalis G3]|eukprot:XP_001583780.1 ankyrin repeat protein [Trichomonas vaginalis G3]
MNLNFEYIAAHISDYIKNENFFDTFEIEDIKTIMKYSQLTADQYITLLKQSSSTLKANKLYFCTRNANVTIQNFDEVVSILKSVTKYMKFHIFNGIIDFINQKDKELRDSTEEITKLQTELKTLQNQIQNAAKETTVTPINKTHNFSREFLTKLSSLKATNDFDSVYQFFEELSSQGNREMISKACEEGLWKKTKWDEMNVLHVASDKRNLNLVKSLIECGCDKEAKNKYGWTSLIKASERGHLDVVKYLISVGADKEAKDKDGYTPLIIASDNGHLEVVKYLISVGADKEAKNKNGWTPLIIASEWGHLDVVKYLISAGADKEAKDNDGYTPLIFASEWGHLDVVKYLISVGADKEAKTKNGWTSLILASRYGHLEVVKYLISVGADKEAKDKDGYTPLIIASDNGHLEVVKYLISVGADKEAKTNDGKTPLIYADSEVRDYLKSIGAK